MNNNVNFLSNNQVWYNSGGKIIFQSYETVVCEITNFENGNEPIVKITEGQPESKTTAKYLNQFLQIHTSYKSYKEII